MYTGKTGIVRALIEAEGLSHTYIDVATSLTDRSILSSILDDITSLLSGIPSAKAQMEAQLRANPLKLHSIDPNSSGDTAFVPLDIKESVAALQHRLHHAVPPLAQTHIARASLVVDDGATLATDPAASLDAELERLGVDPMLELDLADLAPAHDEADADLGAPPPLTSAPATPRLQPDLAAQVDAYAFIDAPATPSAADMPLPLPPCSQPALPLAYSPGQRAVIRTPASIRTHAAEPAADASRAAGTTPERPRGRNDKRTRVDDEPAATTKTTTPATNFANPILSLPSAKRARNGLVKPGSPVKRTGPAATAAASDAAAAKQAAALDALKASIDPSLLAPTALSATLAGDDEEAPAGGDIALSVTALTRQPQRESLVPVPHVSASVRDVGRVLDLIPAPRPAPFVVVLDNAHRLPRALSLAHIARLADSLPVPLLVVVITRGAWPELPTQLAGLRHVAVPFPTYAPAALTEILVERVYPLPVDDAEPRSRTRAIATAPASPVAGAVKAHGLMVAKGGDKASAGAKEDASEAASGSGLARVMPFNRFYVAHELAHIIAAAVDVNGRPLVTPVVAGKIKAALSESITRDYSLATDAIALDAVFSRSAFAALVSFVVHAYSQETTDVCELASILDALVPVCVQVLLVVEGNAQLKRGALTAKAVLRAVLPPEDAPIAADDILAALRRLDDVTALIRANSSVFPLQQLPSALLVRLSKPCQLLKKSLHLAQVPVLDAPAATAMLVTELARAVGADAAAHDAMTDQDEADEAVAHQAVSGQSSAALASQFSRALQASARGRQLALASDKDSGRYAALLELPVLSRLLLVAAALASYILPKDDAGLFGTRHRRGR